MVVTRVIDGAEKSGSVIYLDSPLAVSNFELNSLDSIFIDTLVSSRPVMYMEGAVLKQTATLDGDDAGTRL